MQEFFENILMHVGVSKLDGAPGPGSGRYPLGSGKNPYQHRIDFLARVETYKDQGLKGKELAAKFGLTTTELDTQISLAKDEIRLYTVNQVKKLRSKGMGWTEIARTLGLKNESTARGLMSESALSNTMQAKVTADYLKKIVDEYGMVDVSGGTEYALGVSKEKLRKALAILKVEYGYEVYKGGVPQGAKRTGKQTNQMVLCDTKHSYKDIYDYENVHSVLEYDKTILTEDGTKERPAFHYPESLDSKRLQIVYDEDGGSLKDGLVELRRGVEDISLGNDHYAQVRIMVDGTHYIKGMAVYNDNMPPGVDVVFNVHYKKGTPLKGEKGNSVLKPITSDPDNPFGSTIKERGGQRYYDDPKGKFTDPETGKKQSLSVINKRASEGDWDEWSRNLPSQFLSKQSEILVKRQLQLTKREAEAEYDEIMSLTNPTVKKYFLQKFADSCDAAAVHLKAASLPRQSYQVIMPLTTIGDNEIYAPNYKNGEDVVLVRFPYSGPFESPRLKVNNKNPEGVKLFGKNPIDVVGISAKNAAKMSGADFDGDTVMVIPVNTKVNVKTAPSLKGLEDFDDKVAYGFDEVKKDSKGNNHYYRNGREYQIMKDTQKQMGVVSNLITDMTLKGASSDKLARAVRHSMVVIDAEKHKLDWKASEIENDIDSLKREFQMKPNGRYGGAGTLISRASGEATVDKRQGSPRINPETGALEWKTASDLYYNEKKKVKLKDSKGRILKDANGQPMFEKDPVTGKPIWVETGKIKKRTQKSTNMAETPDAHTLSTGHPIEEAYADYANFQKALANKARKEMISTKGVLYDAGARSTYQAEVDSLTSKLKVAEMNRIKTRDARRMAAAAMNAKKPAYLEAGLTKKEMEEELQKEYDRALREARIRTGSKRNPIVITDREWEAIQAGAVHENTLKQILENSDTDVLREKATPRPSRALSDSKIALMKAMQNSGNTNEEIAKRLGVSVSTIVKYLK